MKIPGPTDRVLLAAAGSEAAGAALGLRGWWVVGLMAAGVGSLFRIRRSVRWALILGVLVGCLSGMATRTTSELVMASTPTPGPTTTTVRLLADPTRGLYGWTVRAEGTDGVPILLAGDVPMEGGAFDTVSVQGMIAPVSGSWRGKPFAGRLSVTGVTVLESSWWMLPANTLRGRVEGSVTRWRSPGAALVSGFLIGDIEELPPIHREQLTAAGLSHFVAVSGSNVALFLGLWWLVTAPLASSPRTRAAIGVVGVALFVMVTRWEPSVLRAGAMVATLLIGRAVGIPLTGWGSLAVATVGLVAFDASMVTNVGFQLSAAATAGLLAGSGLLADRGPRWLMAPLGATVAAQAAVAPLLLAHFGSVPILSPLANLVAGPLVAFSTTIGGIGVLLASDHLVRVAIGVAEMVVRIAAVASALPAVGWVGLATGVLLGVSITHRRTRAPAIVAGVVLMLVMLVRGADRGPSVSVFDVGQGDSILITGSLGERILIDGGPDPMVLARKLSRAGVRRLDLVIISHRHADHVTGLSAVLGVLDVGEVWWAPHDEVGAMAPTLELIEQHGIPLLVPKVGTTYRVGTVDIEVLGPMRRYASPNDASLVVVAEVEGFRVALVGDIETYAQADLGPIETDILKVPHQGGATSSPGWLASSAGRLAVVSVGVNDYGHPAAWVIEVLEASGAIVCRTDRDGDVTIPLDQASGSLSGC